MPRGYRIPPHVQDARDRNRAAQLGRVQAARDRLRGGEFLDRVASLIMTTMYTSEHIDVSIVVPTTNPAGRALKPAQRLKARADRITESVDAYAARRITSRQNVIYNAANSPEQQIANSSDIGFDTVAVCVKDYILWVARNFKVRTMANANAGKIQPAAVSTFDRLSPETRENILAGLRSELNAGQRNFDKVNFLEIRPTPRDENEARRPHAEMQLLAYFRGRTQGMRVGVSKGVCPSCQVQLKEKGARFTSFRIHNRPPGNWIPPELIRVGIEARHKM